jgi:dienelactone hydrolase
MSGALCRLLGLLLATLLATLLGAAGLARAADSAVPDAAWRAAAAALPAPVASAPKFEAHEFDWVDSARARSVPVRLYMPLAAAGASSVPLIVFSHGIGGSRRGYTYLGHHWANHGFASLHLQHTGSDRQLWSGNPLQVLGRLHAAAQESEAIHRARDFSFALDQLLAGEHGARIDVARIVAAGHSYGANTTLMVAGARVERAGQALALRDARVRAAIVISAPPFYGESDSARILGPIEIPTLHVTATEDIIRIPGYYSPASDRLAVFEATGGVSKMLAVFEGGSHNIFSDRQGSGGQVLNQQVKSATQALSLAFLKQVLEGDAGLLSDWPKRFAALLQRFNALP